MIGKISQLDRLQFVTGACLLSAVGIGALGYTVQDQKSRLEHMWRRDYVREAASPVPYGIRIDSSITLVPGEYDSADQYLHLFVIPPSAEAEASFDRLATLCERFRTSREEMTVNKVLISPSQKDVVPNHCASWSVMSTNTSTKLLKELREAEKPAPHEVFLSDTASYLLIAGESKKVIYSRDEWPSPEMLEAIDEAFITTTARKSSSNKKGIKAGGSR